MLRPEANAIDTEKLFPEQKEAYVKLLCLLDKAHSNLPDKNFRTNRTIFIDGIAGVGKTSIYLTLKKKLEKKPSSDFIWLEPLELAFLDQPANALADLLTHIQNRCSGPSRPNEKQEGVMRKLARLQRDIALLWDGNPRERAARVQPDAFAAEVSRASRARAGLRKDLNDLIDEVSKEYFDNKLLVLPIDDLHENPAVALAILRLMRVIHSPRLVLLAIGNFHSLRMIEHLRTRRELTSFMHENDIGDQDLIKEIGLRANSLGAFSINKLFCPSQLVEILPPDADNPKSWDSITNFKPIESQNQNGLCRLFSQKLGEAFKKRPADSPKDAFNEDVFNFMIEPSSSLNKRRRIFNLPARSLLRIYRTLDNEDTIKYPMSFCWEMLEECQELQYNGTAHPANLFEPDSENIDNIGHPEYEFIKSGETDHLVYDDDSSRAIQPTIAAWVHLIYHLTGSEKSYEDKLTIRKKNKTVSASLAMCTMGSDNPSTDETKS